jgi:hypothetical protein
MLLHRQRSSFILQNRNKTLIGLLSDKAGARRSTKLWLRLTVRYQFEVCY